jgi:hypothetical protein
MFDVGAEGLRRRAALRVSVDVTDPFGAQRNRGRNCVQADRGRCAADDEYLGAGPLGERWAHRPVTIDHVVGQGAQHRRGESIRCRHQKVIGRRDGQKVGNGAPMAAAGGTETEGPASGCAVRAARTEVSRPAGVTGTARHLERNHYPVADSAPRYSIADRDDLGDRFVPDRERPGKQARRCHRQIDVTTSNGKWAHDGSGRIARCRIRSLAPLDLTRVHERQLPHQALTLGVPRGDHRGRHPLCRRQLNPTAPNKHPE